MCWQCENPGGDFEAGLIEKIRDRGWTVTGVQPDAGEPGWMYTVGLPRSYGHPELVIRPFCDASLDTIWAVAEHVATTGARLEPGQLINLGGVIHGFRPLSAGEIADGDIICSQLVHARLGHPGDVTALEIVPVPELQRCDACIDVAIASWLREAG